MDRPINTRKNSAVALVLVLGMLALLSIIVVAFLSSVSTDLTASRSYEDQANTRALADSAVNLVIAQIRQASTDSTRAWISQPGLIRTFNGPNVDMAFKLYSDDTMQVAGGFDPAATVNQPDTAWAKKPNLYTDLNAPVLNKNKIWTFPIIDGNSMQTVQGAKTGGKAVLTYDVNGDNAPDVDGFSVDPSFVKFASTAAISGTNNPVPMPVKWLYMLKDGTLVPCTDIPGGYDVAVGGATNKPTKDNPIVARVAFWTDDETAKVNVNTASEGTFWDTPIACSYPPSGIPNSAMDPNFDSTKLYEADLAWRSASLGEYQRYPGHPATTSLSPVIGTTLCLALGIPINPTKGSDRAKLTKAITDLIPRVTDDNTYSSLAGTRRSPDASADQFAVAARVPVDTDRLFATPDELFFGAGYANNKRNLLNITNGKQPNEADISKLVSRNRFFLTATSRAPEINLFNKPRVAIWPINLNPLNRTSFDKLFAFCSVVGNYDVSSASNTSKATAPVYFFSRSDPLNSANDMLTSSRNYTLYQYLQLLTARQFPGFGGASFVDKYGADRDQILTEIFDYIRCTNLIDVSEAKTANDLANTAYSMPAGSKVSDLFLTTKPRGQVVPIFMPKVGTPGLRGFGRMPTISEMGLVIMKTTDTAVTGYDPAKQSRLELTLIPKLFCPAAGFPAIADDISLSFSKLNFTVTDDGGKQQSLFTSNPNHEMHLDRWVSRLGRVSLTGGDIGVGTLFGHTTNFPTTPSVPPNAHFQVEGKSSTNKITVQGSVDVTISTFSAKGTEPTLQTFTFTFPKFTAPIPVRDGNLAHAYQQITQAPNGDEKGSYPAAGYLDKGYRLTAGSTGQPDKLPVAPDVNLAAIFSNSDVIRSVVPTGVGDTGVPIQGDMRLVSALKKVPPTIFQPSKTYSGGGLQAHSLRKSYFASKNGGGGAIVPGATFGHLFNNGGPNGTYAGADFSSDIPDGINAVTNSLGQAGDWDNGPALMPDGAFINKADEGVKSSANAFVPYISNFFDTGTTQFASGSFFSPNRLIPSPVMFGSLSTGVQRGLPWQTLLFRPAATYLPGGLTHPGAVSPPDHLLLDLFWMPVVEPYAISEPFATAGKINLNYQIAPFGYIKRDTGMRAVLQSSMITALNPNAPSVSGNPFINGSKNPADAGSSSGVVTRQKVDVDETMKNIEATHFKVGVNKPFISASEICTVPLVPSGLTASGLSSFWKSNIMTGDNSLERPYALLYPRLTTKSNSYTVHVRVQTLKKAPADTNQAIFRDGRDQVLGEFRGSFVIERYLDANTAGFYTNGDITKKSDETKVDGVLGPYKFRVVNSKQFGL